MENWPSKTDVGCDCSYLSEASRNPVVPIKFDAALNEFHLIYGLPDAYMLIRHCPFCGGKAPISKRASLFAEIPAQEQYRLAMLTNSLQRLEDVIAAFGKPDYDRDVGMMVTTPAKDGMAPETRAYRVLVYTRLSEVADVHATILADDRVSITFAGKFIGGEST